MNKKQLKTRNTEPQGRLASVNLTVAGDKDRHKAGVIEAIKDYVKGRGEGPGQKKRKRHPEAFGKSITPNGLVIDVIKNVYMLIFWLWSEHI